MIDSCVLADDKFWSAIEYLDTLTRPVPVTEIFGALDIDDDDLAHVLTFLKDFNYSVERDRDTGTMLLYPPADRQEIIYNFSPNTMYMVNKIEDSFVKGRHLTLSFYNHKQLDFFVHELVFVEGKLSVVGEEERSGTIALFALDELQDVKINLDDVYRAHFSEIEISDFLSAELMLSDNVKRVILKFNSEAKLSEPRFHYLENPFVTANWNGDKIWAATVEVNDYFFEWILSFGDQVEILEPSDLSSEICDFCSRHLDLAGSF